MNINYGLFFSFRNISDKNREEYDLKKHQGQNIWKGNRYRLIASENKPRILTFSRRRQNRLNGFLGETRTARTRVWASCAHASLCKFTSGSRRSLSSPRILRSLLYCIWGSISSEYHLIKYEEIRAPFAASFLVSCGRVPAVTKWHNTEDWKDTDN